MCNEGSPRGALAFWRGSGYAAARMRLAALGLRPPAVYTAGTEQAPCGVEHARIHDTRPIRISVIVRSSVIRSQAPGAIAAGGAYDWRQFAWLNHYSL